MKKVLFTGADGFIGHNVLQYMLNNTDWEFTLICSWKHKGNPFNVPISNRVTVITHDLRGPIPDLGEFDYILHMASESHVDRSIDDPVSFIENNVSITLNMLEYARQQTPEKFLLFSTDEVYGANDHYDWDVHRPTNPYAASKCAQEDIAIAYANTYKLPIIITNSNNIVGPGQNPEKYVPKLIDAIKNRKVVTVHAENGKFGKRFYNPVQNVGSALVKILSNRYNAKQGKPDMPARYSINGGEELDNLEIAMLVAKILGRQLKYKVVDVNTVRPAYDAFYDESNTDALGAEFKWEPPYKLERGLQWIKSM